MKNNTLNLLIKLMFISAFFALVLNSCKKEDPLANPIASFQYKINATNYLEVEFTNYSQNAVTYEWNFGNTKTSTEENPTHAFAATGTYTITLTAFNEEGASAEFAKEITIVDPNVAQKLLTGEVSKTWKLYRVGRSMGVGPNAEGAGSYWALENDGTRPVVYTHEFTFNADGSFVFDDNGFFWGEASIFEGTPVFETAFEAIAANMVNSEGTDVSAWLGGTHSFTYDPSTGDITLNGLGAWMGMPQLGTSAASIVPETTKTFKGTITDETGYDLLHVEYFYAELYWDFWYVSYENMADEPALVTEAEPFGTDLPDITPTELSRTFVSNDASEWVLLDTIQSASTIVYGVADPAGVGANVGQFNRTSEVYQELQFQTSPVKNDINFSSLTTISIEVYFPSTNTYGDLTKNVIIGFGDKSATEQWWTDNIEYHYDGTSAPEDTWVTMTFTIANPDYTASGQTPLERNDLDMLYINIGGSGHSATGTFFIRNLMINTPKK